MRLPRGSRTGATSVPAGREPTSSPLPSRRIVAGTSRARTISGVDEDRDEQGDADQLDERDRREVENAGDHDDQQQGRAVMIPAGALQPGGDRGGVVAGAVVLLPDPGEQEHLVVHRQPEQRSRTSAPGWSTSRNPVLVKPNGPPGARPGRSTPARRTTPTPTARSSALPSTAAPPSRRPANNSTRVPARRTAPSTAAARRGVCQQVGDDRTVPRRSALPHRRVAAPPGPLRPRRGRPGPEASCGRCTLTAATWPSAPASRAPSTPSA